MADSDDEYEKKIRDKFRGERDRADSYKGMDHNRREDRRPPRDEWMERLVERLSRELIRPYVYSKIRSYIFFIGKLGVQDREVEEIFVA